VIRNRIKDALRASIDTEDEALIRRLPEGSRKRKASVKLSTRLMSAAAEAPDIPQATAAKPLEVHLSSDEAAILKAARARLREAGHAPDKNDMVRLAVSMLAHADTEAIAALLERLPALKRPKG
jgi:hypothetical protein